MQIMPCRYQGLVAALAGYSETGVPLVLGKDIPPGCAGCDPIGPLYFIPQLVNFLGMELDTAINVFYIGIVSISFLIAALSSLRYCKTSLGRLISLLALLMLSTLILLIGDVYIALGATAMALVPWWLIVQGGGAYKARLFFCVIAGLIISSAYFIRSYAGMDVLLFIIMSLLFTKRYSWKHKAICGITLLGSMLIVFLYFAHLVQQRDAFYLTNVGRAYHQPLKLHGFWHQTYIGFGFLNNEYGITYHDGNAAAKVASIDPNAGYASLQYDAILKMEVWRLIKNDPYFFFRTVFAKLGGCLMYLLIFANVGLILAYIYPKERLLDFAFAGAMGFNALFGILVLPLAQYLLGLISFSTIYGMISIDFALHKGFLKRLLVRNN